MRLKQSLPLWGDNGKVSNQDSISTSRTEFTLRLYIIAVAIAVVILQSGLSYATTGLAYLTIPNGAREAAMGETGVSHAEGGAAAWWNPALIATENSVIEFQIMNWIADGQGSFGGARFRTGWGGFGLYYFNLGIENFELRDRPGPPVGSFDVYDAVFAAGVGFKAGERTSAGLVWKSYHEQIYGATYSGSGLIDLGVHWQGTSFALGVSTANLELWDYQTEDLPFILRSGISYSRKLDQFRVVTALEIVSIENQNDYVHFGVETGWLNSLFLRAGYMAGHDSRSASFGMGAVKDRYRADLAITPYDFELGAVWRVSFGLEL